MQYKAEIVRPTGETYNELQMAYDYFNQVIFENKLPNCLITLQRQKRAFGYFCPERFAKRSGDTTDEIAMNPSYFAIRPIVASVSTLVHEMVHLWQHHYGSPGRGRYHNQEWGEKMETIGLMPSSTGKPGGNRTGDRVSHYIIENGAFINACRQLLTKDFTISWYDRFTPYSPPEEENEEEGSENENSENNFDIPESGMSIAARSGVEIETIGTVNNSNRSKYTCPCQVNVWGKPGLQIVCGSCNTQFTERY